MKEKKNEIDVTKEVNELVANAMQAWRDFGDFDQEKIDYIVAKCSVAGLDNHGILAKAAIDETGRGVFEDKATKNLFACEYVVKNKRHLKTVGIISENPTQKNNTKKKRKYKKKQLIENEEISTNNFSKQKSILSEIKSIPIPNSDDGKKELIKNLKISLIEIDNLINLLIKKRDYYNEIINSIEKEFMKKEELFKKEKINQEKSNILIQELLSI